jgi:HPt (histidine-containing phosphotransfer) domain-containing protein
MFVLADALQAVDGCYDRLQAIVEFYFSDTPLLVQKIRAGLANRDAAAVRRAAHRLAGTLVYLRVQPALAAARRVDELSVAGDLQGAAEVLPALEHELALLDEALLPHRSQTQRQD